MRTWFKKLRERKGLSQKALAEHLDVSRTIVQLWEAGKETPSRRHAVALDALLGGARHTVLSELLREMRSEVIELRRVS